MYTLKTSTRKNKKFSINGIHFGDSRYEDFTSHKDEKRKNNYLARHAKNEDWTKSGIDTAGFWSRWVLWNRPTLQNSIKDVEKRFNIKIIH